jgi:hypothetical protein
MQGRSGFPSTVRLCGQQKSGEGCQEGFGKPFFSVVTRNRLKDARRSVFQIPFFCVVNRSRVWECGLSYSRQPHGSPSFTRFLLAAQETRILEASSISYQTSVKRTRKRYLETTTSGVPYQTSVKRTGKHPRDP